MLYNSIFSDLKTLIVTAVARKLNYRKNCRFVIGRLTLIYKQTKPSIYFFLIFRITHL